MVQNISQKELKFLKAEQGKQLLTIYLPLEKGLSGHKHNVSQLHSVRARLKKILLKNEVKLISDMLETISQELGYNNTGLGLLVLWNGKNLKAYTLPFTRDVSININNKYDLEPIDEYYRNDKQYYVLAISKNGSKLYSADSDNFEPIFVDGLDKDLETMLSIDEKQSHILQNHPVAAGGTAKNSEGYHGQGGYKDMKKTLYDKYLRAIDKMVTKAIGSKKAPLVLVAVNYGQSAYKHISKYPKILAKGVDTNPDDLTLNQLHIKTLSLLR